jgi:hypothetical protein
MATKRTVKRTTKKKSRTSKSVRSIKLSSEVASQIRSMLADEMGIKPNQRIVAYLAYYDPPGICIQFGPN